MACTLTAGGRDSVGHVALNECGGVLTCTFLVRENAGEIVRPQANAVARQYSSQGCVCWGEAVRVDLLLVRVRASRPRFGRKTGSRSMRSEGESSTHQRMIFPNPGAWFLISGGWQHDALNSVAAAKCILPSFFPPRGGFSWSHQPSIVPGAAFRSGSAVSHGCGPAGLE